MKLFYLTVLTLFLSASIVVPFTHANADDEASAVGESVVDNSESSGDVREYIADNSYRLGPDDVLKITVFGEGDLTDSYKISSNGFLSFPLIDDLNVEGLTLNQVEGVIEEKLSEGFLVNPSVAIEVASYRPFYILGEVRVPGSYSYVSGISVLKAVALAGGFTYRANKKHVKVLKTHEDGTNIYEEIPVNASIAPGDIILVKERFF